MALFLFVLFVIVVGFFYGIGMRLAVVEIIKSIAFALFVGAPFGGIIAFFIINILRYFCIWGCNYRGLDVYVPYVIAIPMGLIIGSIIVLLKYMTHYENARNQSLDSYEKHKNDEKRKRY